MYRAARGVNLLRLFVVLCLLTLGTSLRIFKKWAAITLTSAAVLQGGPVPHLLPAYAANDALVAAQRAMLDTKDKELRVKSFDEMNAAGKKRYALSECKDSSRRKSAGYTSASECTAAVLGGDYASIVVGREAEPKVIFDNKENKASVFTAPKPAPAPASSPVRIQALASVSAPAPAPAPAANRRDSAAAPARKKTNDLSGVSSAGRRRRALAACKKSDIRKQARMGTESGCTERVINGNFDAIIEVLEYQ